MGSQGVVTCAYNPRTWEGEAKGSGVLNHPLETASLKPAGLHETLSPESQTPPHIKRCLTSFMLYASVFVEIVPMEDIIQGRAILEVFSDYQDLQDLSNLFLNYSFKKGLPEGWRDGSVRKVPDNLSLTPQDPCGGSKEHTRQSCKLLSDFHICALADMCVCTSPHQTNERKKKKLRIS